MQSRKSLLAKIFGAFCALLCVIALAFGLAACDSNSDTVKSVVGMSVENGQLVLEYSDGSTETIDLGDLKGDTGDTGATGPQGPEGPQGDAGRGIVSVAADENGNLVITYTDGTTQTVEMPAASDEDCEHAHISWYKLDGYAYIATTNTYEGTLLEVCDDCGYAWLWKNEEHVGHHVWKEVPAEDPTCCAPGHTAGTVCEVCGVYGENTEEIPATGNHVWDEGHLVYSEKENVCEQGGVYIYLCETEGCDAYYINEDLEVRGHKVSTWTVEKAPSATEAGVLTGTCSECGEDVKVTLPVLNDANVANGTYTRVLKVDGGCEDDSTYTYTYTLNAGAVLTVDSVIGLATDTTVEYTGTTNYTQSWDVTVKGGYHVILDIDGQPVNVAIDATYGGTVDGKVMGILEYPGLNTFGNITNTCQDITGEGDSTSAGAVYFDCVRDGCGQHVYVRVQGYHMHNGELVTSLDDECVTYHPATCSSPASYTMHCDICGDVVLAEGSLLDPDNHVYDEDSVEIVENSDGTITVTYTCTENEKHVYEVTGKLESERTYTEQGTTCLVTVTERVISYTDPDGNTQKVTLTSKSGGEAHAVVVNGITYNITSVINTEGSTTATITVEWTDASGKPQSFKDDTIVSDSPVAAIVEFFGNVPTTCVGGGSQAFIDCDVCHEHILIMYQVAHTPTLTAEGAIDYTAAGCKAPTCTENGTALCTVCGNNYEVEGSALGHNYTIADYSYDPSITEGNNFTLEFYCTRCDEYGSAEDPTTIAGNYDALKKAGYIVETQAQTCTSDLIINIVNYPVEGGVINATNLNLGKSEHHWTNGKVLDGSLTVVYNIDEWGDLIEDFINVPINCQAEGYAFTTCRDCGEYILIRVSGHHTPGAEPVVAQSHTTAAVYECVDCGAHFFVGDPAQHTWTLKADSVKVPTATTEGSATYVCTCGKTAEVKIPKIGSEGLTYTTTKDCEHGTTNTYSATLTFSVTETSTHTYNNAYTENKDATITKSTTTNYTVNFYYQDKLGDAGHDKYVEGETIVYSWIYPEDENGTVYVGYICSTCGNMIVLWNENMVDDSGLPVENTYKVDVYLESLIPGVAYPGSVVDVNRMLPWFEDGLYGDGISAVFAADGTGYFVADGDPDTAVHYGFTWTYTEAGLVISSDVDMSAIGITISATPVAVTYGTTARGLEYYAFTYSGIEFSQVIDPELEGEPDNPGTEDPGTEDPAEPVEHKYSFSYDALTDAIEAVTGASAADKTQLDSAYFTGENSFLTVTVAAGSDQYRTSGGGCFEIKGGTVSVTFEGTGTLTLRASSTGSNNTSSIGLIDSEGNYITATTTAVAAEGGWYEVSTTTYVELVFEIDAAGTYTIVNPVDESGLDRGVRIQNIDMVDIYAE